MALISYNQLKEVLTDFKTKIKATFVEDITYNAITNKLSKTKNGNTEVVVDHVVENWGDLEHTKYAPIKNLFNKDTQVEENKKYTFVSNGGEIHQENNCRIARIPCKAGDKFTVVKGARHDSKQMGVFNSSNRHIQAMTVNEKDVKGKQVYKVTISSTLVDAHHFVFNMYNQYVSPDEVMVFEGHLTDDQIPSKYYPNLGNYTTVIDGDKVAMQFDSQNITLTSNTVVDAIKEISREIDALGSSSYQKKKILVYGDLFASQTQWQDYVKNHLGADLITMSFADAPLTTVHNSDTNLPLSSNAKITELRAKIDAESPDILLIVAGANDFYYDGYTIPGEGVMKLEDPLQAYDTNTIKGALNTLFTNILVNHPNVQVIVCTYPNIQYPGNSTSDYTDEGKNLEGITIQQINQTIRDTCLFMGIPCVDVYALCGIGKLNRSVHIDTPKSLNDRGHKAMANAVLGELLRMNKRIM